MPLILAVSGGIDSMVMLDLLVRRELPENLIVAHFDHAIRPHSAIDCQFVERAAQRYGLRFISERASTAPASEAEARTLRYNFLRRIAGSAPIYTAHHLDDLVETVAINLLRGTGWRGLAVLDSPGIKRPLLDDWRTLGFSAPPDKTALYRYAGERTLTFREDESNSSDEYLRNRLRQDMNNHFLHYSLDEYEKKQKIYTLWQNQRHLRQEIDQILGAELLDARPSGAQGPNLPPTSAQDSKTSSSNPLSRTWLCGLPDAVALEVLRSATLAAGISTTRPQLTDFLNAIHTYAPGKFFNLPGGHLVKLTKTAILF